jgi:hypothetical protein
MAIGGGAMELLIKAKAGFNVEKMLVQLRSDPDVATIVTELQAEIANDVVQGEGRDRPRVEPGSSYPALTDPGRSAGPGAQAAAAAAAPVAHPPAAGPVSTPGAAGTGRRAGR